MQNGSRAETPTAADREAAGLAENVIPPILREVSQGSTTPMADIAAALIDPSLMPPRVLVSVVEVRHEEVEAAVYYRWEDQSFSAGFWGGVRYGRACRVYSLEHGEVQAEPVSCRSDVPDEPLLNPDE